MIKSLFNRKWSYAVVGGFIGVLYVILDEGILDQVSSQGASLLIAHEFLDAIFPVLLGISLGMGIHFFKKQKRMNRSLSLKKEKLEKELLLNMLISQMLHEIQNPLHNISAAFEDTQGTLTAEKFEIVKRNLGRLNELKKRYGNWDWAENLEAEEPIDFKSWMASLIEDRIGFQIKGPDIHLTQSIDAVSVRVHPVLLEQIIITVLENAFEAMQSALPRRLVRIEAGLAGLSGSRVLIRISNNGSPFSADVLAAQGRRPVASRHGMGLGLLLLNKAVEQVGGKISLSNEGGLSVVSLELPGARA